MDAFWYLQQYTQAAASLLKHESLTSHLMASLSQNHDGAATRKAISMDSLISLTHAYRYMWRHGYNTSFYQVAEQMASPATKATVLSTIITRNDSTFPTDADYFKILQTCKAIS